MADHKLAQVMEAMKNNLSASLSQLAPLAESKSQEIPESCYARYENNPDKFAECITSSQKKLN